MAAYINPDLHSHSTFSDGVLTPEEVAARARANGVDLWALTDHDGLSGQERAVAAARAQSLDYLTGVEVSVTWADTTVHVVGLGVDPANTALIAGLDQTRSGRDTRARDMAAKLEQLTGLNGLYEAALQYAGNREAIARPHFARLLVDRGLCKNMQTAFSKYLRDGGPAFVPHRWATLADALSWITGAGGLAILAHPARYRFKHAQEGALIDEFKRLGGRGIEVTTGSHTAAEAVHYATVARENSLLASRGSDFHATGEGRADIGTLPALPADLPTVWDALASHIRHAP